MKNPIDKMWEWIEDGNDLYSAFGKLVFVGVGLYVLFAPITIPMSIYYTLTEKPDIPPKPTQETEEQRARREARAAKFKFKKNI